MHSDTGTRWHGCRRGCVTFGKSASKKSRKLYFLFSILGWFFKIFLKKMFSTIQSNIFPLPFSMKMKMKTENDQSRRVLNFSCISYTYLHNFVHIPPPPLLIYYFKILLKLTMHWSFHKTNLLIFFYIYFTLMLKYLCNAWDTTS